MAVIELLEKIAQSYQSVLREKLVGIYVHGSIAFQCFNRKNSDIDFLVVVEDELTQAEKETLIVLLFIWDKYAPKKGFEMSVVLKSVCKPFVYPTPYELHYSNRYRKHYVNDLAGVCATLHGTDKDLAAHVTVINAVGFPLCGPPVSEVFGEVSKEDYLDSILYDVEEAEEEIGENPVYFILNLCRVAAYVKDDLVLSKKQGGEWGLQHLPEECHKLVGRALQMYVADTDARLDSCDVCCAQNGESVWNVKELKCFADEMLRRIGKRI